MDASDVFWSLCVSTPSERSCSFNTATFKRLIDCARVHTKQRQQRACVRIQHRHDAFHRKRHEHMQEYGRPALLWAPCTSYAIVLRYVCRCAVHRLRNERRSNVSYASVVLKCNRVWQNIHACHVTLAQLTTQCHFCC